MRAQTLEWVAGVLFIGRVMEGEDDSSPPIRPFGRLGAPAAHIQLWGRLRQISINLHVPTPPPRVPHHVKLHLSSWAKPNLRCPPLTRSAASSSLKGPGASKPSSFVTPGKGYCWGKRRPGPHSSGTGPRVCPTGHEGRRDQRARQPGPPSRRPTDLRSQSAAW